MSRTSFTTTRKRANRQNTGGGLLRTRLWRFIDATPSTTATTPTTVAAAAPKKKHEKRSAAARQHAQLETHLRRWQRGALSGRRPLGAKQDPSRTRPLPRRGPPYLTSATRDGVDTTNRKDQHVQEYDRGPQYRATLGAITLTKRLELGYTVVSLTVD